MSDNKLNLREEMLKFDKEYKKGNLKEKFIEEIKKSVPKNRSNKITFTKDNIIYVAIIINIVLTEKEKSCEQDQKDLLFYEKLYNVNDIDKYIKEGLKKLEEENNKIKKDKSVLQNSGFKSSIEKIFDCFKLTNFQSYVSKLDLLKRILYEDRILVPIFLAVNKEKELQYAPYSFSINQFMFLLSAIVSPPIIKHFDFGYSVDDEFTLNIQCCQECPEFLYVVIPLLCEKEYFGKVLSSKLLNAFKSKNFNLEAVKYSLHKTCNPIDRF